MVRRRDFIGEIEALFRDTRCVALIGPRQCGKTTLAQEYLKSSPGAKWFLDLEDPTDLAKLENPKLYLEDLEGTIVLDEVQNRPDLFPTLRVLLDQKRKKQKFLILGSASPELLRQSSETLAGRIQFLEIRPFGLNEVPNLARLWLRGGFPLSYLARSEAVSVSWRRAFVETFLERDLRRLGIEIPIGAMRRFWMMLVHYHGGNFNASEIGKAMGLSDKTMRRYLDILTGTFMIRELRPWYENISKRQVKTPKIYFRDSGLFHALLDIRDAKQLKLHPKLGASWEGFALEETIRHLHLTRDEVFFWAVHAEAELDLFFHRRGKRYGVEVKFTDRPKITASMRSAMKVLGLAKIFIVYPGQEGFLLDRDISVIPISNLGKMQIL